MKAIVTVLGRDQVGIIADVCATLAEYQVNILDISQTIMQEYFTMIMLVDIDALKIPFTNFVDKMSALGKESGLVIQTMHEDIFNSMHKI